MKTSKTAILGLTAIICLGSAIAKTGIVEYPAGFRSWQHVKTAIIEPGHPLEDTFGGIHHIYANATAMSGLQNGTYEEGAIFVFDILDYERSDFLVVESDRVRIDVMQYDDQAFADTGGWGFASFTGPGKAGRVEQDVVAACYNCHIPAKESGYVFSKYRP